MFYPISGPGCGPLIWVSGGSATQGVVRLFVP